eukprot:6740172-Prymnesium_polylepis.1
MRVVHAHIRAVHVTSVESRRPCARVAVNGTQMCWTWRSWSTNGGACCSALHREPRASNRKSRTACTCEQEGCVHL